MSEKQFGFRPQRSTVHAITLANITLESNHKSRKTSLIATRDVCKAFDSVWHRGLLFKINEIFSNIDNKIDIIILIKEFLEMREITPIFNQVKGKVIKPLAGVPQGSSLGPILYLIFSNDHPKPIHTDTIITQYADDMVHIVCSDGHGRKRTKQAIQKMEHELTNTLQWEQNWKIKTNLQKSNIHYLGTSKETLEKFGGVRVNNTNIPIKKETKILGTNIRFNTKGNYHAMNVAKKARIHQNKLYRFINAPEKVKKTLFKTLIRPIMEYPCTILHKIHKTYTHKLQVVQNKGLRFIKNVKFKDRVNMKDIHQELNIEPINVRISRLKNKVVNRMKENYYVKQNQDRNIFYKFSDFTLSHPPIRKRRYTVAQRIERNILNPRGHNNIIKQEPSIDNWQEPEPIYSTTRTRTT